MTLASHGQLLSRYFTDLILLVKSGIFQPEKGNVYWAIGFLFSFSLNLLYSNSLNISLLWTIEYFHFNLFDETSFY